MIPIQFLFGLILISVGASIIIYRRKIFDRIDSETKGKFARWYWGVDNVCMTFRFRLNFLFLEPSLFSLALRMFIGR